MMPTLEPRNPQKEIQIDFKGVSIGKEICRIGFAVDRDLLPLEVANALFCGMRLDVRLSQTSDAPGQQTFWEEDVPRLEASADVKQFSVKQSEYGAGLTLALASLESTAILAKFANRPGWLEIYTTTPLEECEAMEDPDTDARREPDLLDGDGEARSEEDRSWREMPITGVIRGNPAKLLAKKGITTVGALEDFKAKHGVFWIQEVKGLGTKTADAIEEALDAMWRERDDFLAELEGHHASA
jgi:hypothetical protein